MISILIADDDQDKLDRVLAVLTRIPGITKHSIDQSKNLIQTRDYLSTRQYDLLILDLRIPNRDGDRLDDTAGGEFIREITLSRTLIKPFHIIGLTAHEAAFNKTDEIFLKELWRVIRYDRSSSDWERQLSTKLTYLVASKQQLTEPKANANFIDVAIITALHKPELEAVLDLPGNWVEARYPNDSTTYHLGTFERDGKRLKVVAVAAHQMGMPAAAVLTMKVISRFRPALVAMTGISAGIRGAANIGDIVVADQSWDYGSGKRRVVEGKAVLLPDPKSIPLTLDIKERFQHIQSDGNMVSKIERRWRGPVPSTRLQLIIGPMASGASVVQVLKRLSITQEN